MKDAPPLLALAGAAFTTPFGAVLMLAPDGGAPIYVDGRRDPPQASAAIPADITEPDCAWRAAPDILQRIIGSKRAVENALINGRLAIAGDMSVMARLKMAGET